MLCELNQLFHTYSLIIIWRNDLKAIILFDTYLEEIKNMTNVLKNTANSKMKWIYP